MHITINVHCETAAEAEAVVAWLGRMPSAELPIRVREREPGDDDEPVRPAPLTRSNRGDIAPGLVPPARTAPAVAPEAPYVASGATSETRRPPPTPVYDGVPRTGQALYRWACDRKILPQVNSVGKARGWPKLVTHWEVDQVTVAYAEVNAAASNGRHHEGTRA